MEYTLDTAAIRRRFEQAIIGIRQDGTMAVLVPCEVVYGPMPYLDIVTGISYTLSFDYDAGRFVSTIFPALIRPGDRCEVDVCSDWEMATYRGLTGDWERPFYAQVHGDTLTVGFSHIRPLPAAETESTNGCTCQDCGRVYKVDWLIPDAVWKQIQDRGEGGLLCGSCIAARVENLGAFNALHFKPETVSDYPSRCSDRNTFTAAETEVEKKPSAYGFCPVCGNPGKYRERRIDGNDHCMNGHVYPSKDALQEPMSIHTRLTAAEQELAAIRAEMKQVQK